MAGVGQVNGGQVNGVVPVGVQQAPQNGNVQQAPGWFSTSTLNKLVENVFGGTVHALSNAMRGMDLYVQSEMHAWGGPAPDLAEISRTTILGILPNAPGFQSAITNGNAGLSGQFLNAMNTAANTPQGAVMTLLDGVAVNAAANNILQRGGQALQMTQQQFHAGLMRGCHFVVNDQGALANDLQVAGGANMLARSSSHYKDSTHQQYGMDLPGGVGHLLIGRTSNGDTFFQLESHGVGNPQQGWGEWAQEFAGHMQSWGMHVGSSSSYVQIGPHGAIEGSEKDNNHVVVT